MNQEPLIYKSSFWGFFFQGLKKVIFRGLIFVAYHIPYVFFKDIVEKKHSLISLPKEYQDLGDTLLNIAYFFWLALLGPFLIRGVVSFLQDLFERPYMLFTLNEEGKIEWIQIFERNSFKTSECHSVTLVQASESWLGSFGTLTIHFCVFANNAFVQHCWTIKAVKDPYTISDAIIKRFPAPPKNGVISSVS